MQKSKKGITLIALVVTIVVLLILAGITINMIFGNGGIFKTAQEAANAWNEATINEQESLTNIADQIGNLVNGQVGGGSEGGSGGSNKPTVPPGWDLNKVTPVPSEDKPSVNVPVPKGFTASTVNGEKTVEGGFVIKQDGTNNEFVWIPVSAERLAQMYTEVETPVALIGGTGVTTSIYSKLNITTNKPGEAGYREPDLVVGNGSEYDASPTFQTIVGVSNTKDFAQKMVAEYQEIHDSIKQYGGFYIGRYELTGSTTSPTVAKGGTVIGNQNWYHLKASCMKIVNNAGKQENEIVAKTTMIYGNQWDAVCDWLSSKGYNINDSSSWGNYDNYNTTVSSDKQVDKAGEKTTAGYSEYWKANNIYDLAGNCTEWTQEGVNTNIRAIRGGNSGTPGSDVPVSTRGHGPPDFYTDPDISTRTTLYVK